MQPEDNNTSATSSSFVPRCLSGRQWFARRRSQTNTTVFPMSRNRHFDKSSEAFLNADYSDKVVVNVAYSTNIQKLDVRI